MKQPFDRSDSAAPLVEVESVRVEFDELVAVRDISLSLRAGDLLGLIGPNGAGKTTLMRAMCGLQPPTSGRTVVMGRDVMDDEPDVRRHIVIAPDSPPVYEDLTIDRFLTFIALAYGLDFDVAMERTEFWLEQLWLTEKRYEKIRNLSRGMRQRVTVARTLVPNPTVILLDEPSAGLDPAGRIQFRKVLASLRDQGKVLVVSSHILADLEEYCTHIAIIEHGRLLRFGAVGELHGRRVGRQRYQFSVANEGHRVRAVLAGIANITEVVQNDGVWSLEYDDGAVPASQLLKTLVAHDLAVASFSIVADDLEDMYLRSGVKQVD